MIWVKNYDEEHFVYRIADIFTSYTYGPGINSPQMAEQVYALVMGWA